MMDTRPWKEQTILPARRGRHPAQPSSPRPSLVSSSAIVGRPRQHRAAAFYCPGRAWLTEGVFGTLKNSTLLSRRGRARAGRASLYLLCVRAGRQPIPRTTCFGDAGAVGMSV
jgi:hypothetical protein